MSSWSFSKFVRADKKAKAGKKEDLRPVSVAGGELGRTWWGKAWNENLESYAEYSDLIGRGKSVVRCEAIVDLQVSAGEIRALVQGTRAKPYQVTITVKKLNRNTWNMVMSACKGKLASLEELLAGTFPKAVQETFMQRRTGLFPSPREIEFTCSCPDWASMCKHIAGTLYGIGARIDEDRTFFFTLRDVAAVDLIRRAASSKAQVLVRKSSKKSAANEGAGRFADRAEKAGSSSSAVSTEMSWEEGARVADVRRTLKKQVKLDSRSLPKRKPSTTSGAKNMAPRTPKKRVH